MMTEHRIGRPRFAALYRDEALDPAAKRALGRIIQVAKRLFDVKFVTMSLVESEKVWFKAQIGNDLSDISTSENIRREAASGHNVLVVADASNDPRFAESALVRSPAGLRFYAGAPLIDTEGICIGTLSIGDTRPRWDFGAHEAETLRELAQTAITEMEFRGIIAEQRNLLADLTFRQELNAAIAKARDFDAALREILRRACAFLNAVYCVVPQINADGATCRFIVGVVAPTAGAKIETQIAEILRNQDFPIERLSSAQALMSGCTIDSGAIDLDGIPAAFEIMRHLAAAGVSRQITAPLDLGARRCTVMVGFTRANISDREQNFLGNLVAWLTPLLRGRLREDDLERSRQQLARANQALQTLIRCNQAVVEARSEHELIGTICRLVAETGGYNAAWVGLAENGPDRPIRVVGKAGTGLERIEQLRISWGNTTYGNGPSGRAIQENRIILIRDILNDPSFAPWRDEATRTGITSCLALPIRDRSNTPFGVLTLYVTESHGDWPGNSFIFDDEEKRLLEELATGLAHGITALRDRAERDNALARERASEAQLADLLAASPTILYAIERHEDAWRPIEISSNLSRLLGHTMDEALRPGWWDAHVHPEDRAAARAALAKAQAGERMVHHYRFANRQGAYRWIRDEIERRTSADGTERLVGAWVDVTEKQIADAEIQRLAFNDALTGLPNRHAWHRRLTESAARRAMSGRNSAVLLLDLDGLKSVNDVHGHVVGDSVLAECSRRLVTAVRASDVVARLDGSAFGILLTGLPKNPAGAAARAQEIAIALATKLAAPINIDGRLCHLTASIGIVLWPTEHATAETIMRSADVAMSVAKSSIGIEHGGRVAIFEAAMQEAVTSRHAIEAELRSALDEYRLEVWLQSQVDRAGQVVGAEALVRLRSRDGRLLAPGSFIPIAEATGLIVQIGQWMQDAICRILASTPPEILPRIALNVSPIEFRMPDFVSALLSRLTANRIDPRRLVIEVTESLLIERLEDTSAKFELLNDRNIALSIDDFGTGYSSFTYLNRLPVHEFKLDQRFIGQLPYDRRSADLVEAMLSMARRLGLRIVAEGVETEEQAAFLRLHRCPILQGYLFGRPTPAPLWLDQARSKFIDRSPRLVTESY